MNLQELKEAKKKIEYQIEKLKTFYHAENRLEEIKEFIKENSVDGWIQYLYHKDECLLNNLTFSISNDKIIMNAKAMFYCKDYRTGGLGVSKRGYILHVEDISKFSKPTNKNINRLIETLKLI